MKKTLALSVIVLAIAMTAASVTTKQGRVDQTLLQIKRQYAHRVAVLDSFLRRYPIYFYDSSAATRERKFEELAFYFKQATGFIVYFEPDLYYSKLAGPFHFERTDQKDFYGPLSNAWLFQGPIGNEPDSILLKEFKAQDSVAQEKFILNATNGYRSALVHANYMSHLDSMDAPQLFDALRKEMIRISTVDIGNSDFIVDEAAIPGLNGSMDSWLLFTGDLAAALPDTAVALQRHWADLSAQARTYLAAHRDFRSFDRMFFTTHCLLPLSHALTAIQLALDVRFLAAKSAVRPDAGDIYAAMAFNNDYFAPDSNAFFSREKAALGQLLFFDPVLSDNGRRACASCHKPSLAFTDGKKKSVSFQFDDLPRNSPTVINAGFQANQFWDLRAASLEAQLDSVVNNPDELHSSFDHLVARLNSSEEYKERFVKAFPDTKNTGITRAKIRYAIGAYERTLTGLNSRFDQYMRGDTAKLNASEINGFNLFMGKARCGVCHFTPLFNGSVPPFYNISDNHSLGIPVKDSMNKYIVDPDLGLMKIARDSLRRFSFKTPTVRNASLTAPYMHNGVFATLDQVVDFYNLAGGNQHADDIRPDMTGLPFLTLLPIPLALTTNEKKDLIAFIDALTDTSAASKTPSRLPRFEAPYIALNKRTVGGEY